MLGPTTSAVVTDRLVGFSLMASSVKLYKETLREFDRLVAGSVVAKFTPPGPLPATVTIPRPVGHDGVLALVRDVTEARLAIARTHDRAVEGEQP